MSGPIRKMIGPAKARLRQYVESANSLLENKPGELDEYESEVEDFLSIGSQQTFCCLKDATKTGQTFQVERSER